MSKEIVRKIKLRRHILFAAVLLALIAGITALIVFKNTRLKIVINGPKSVTVGNDTEYTDAGATGYRGKSALDSLQVESNVDSAVPGQYTVTYTLTYGRHTKTATRKVTITDTTAPVITLNGEQTVTIRQGGTYDEPGYTANDDCDGDLTEAVTVSGMPDLSNAAEGDYPLTYTVSDHSGNKATATRTLRVFVAWSQASSVNLEAGKNIFLTFDDGPCVYTSQLLDILASYNVKATFFVTNQKPDFQDMIAREAKEGHTVAIHTYSHRYSVYESVDTYFDDLNRMNDIIYAQTGSRTNLIRFPGGSSNTISKSYCPGIMSELTREVTRRGYVYFDWNVSSGDASSGPQRSNPDWIASNVIDALGNGNYVVLMHDINKANLESVPKIIEYGLANGYTFAPLTADSPTAHHGVNN